MSFSLRVVSRSGRELATLQLPSDATVKDLKQAFHKKCQPIASIKLYTDAFVNATR